MGHTCIAYSHDATNHWHVCDRCGEFYDLETHTWGTGEITKEATETENGIRTYTCSVCGHTKTETIPATGHEHNYGTLVARVEPTCNTAGREAYYYCADCDTYFTSSKEITTFEALTIPATGSHTAGTPTYTWSDDNLQVTATVYCTSCGELIASETVACDYAITKAATCTVKGQKTYTTRGFNNSAFTTQTKTVDTDYAEHTKEFSTETVGNTTYYVVTCSVCHQELDRRVLGEASSGTGSGTETHTHSWTMGTVTAPTRTTNGSVVWTCDHGESQTLTIQKLGTSRVYLTNNFGWENVYAYIYNSGTDVLKAWPGTQMKYFGTNNSNQSIYYIDYDVAGYTYIIFTNNSGSQTIDITVDNTTTNAYWISDTQENGKYTVGTWSQYTIPSPCTEHQWNDGEVTTPATSNSTGVMTYTCQICGETKTEVIPMTGHTHSYPDEYSFSTTTHYHVCSTCGERVDEEEHDFEIYDQNGKYYQRCTVCDYEEEITISGLKIHYHRADGDYSSFNTIHVWADGLDGAQHKMTSTDSYGIYYTFTAAQVVGKDNFGVIIKVEEAENWTKDGTNKYFKISDLKKGTDGYLHVYFVGGSDGVYTSVAESVSADIYYYNFYQSEEDSNFYMNIGLAQNAVSWKILKNGTEFINSGSSSANLTRNEATYIEYKFGTTLPNVNDVYEVVVTFANGKATKKGNMMYLFNTSAFESTYCFNGALGAIYSASSTTFKVWSPIATEMKVRIYNSGTPSYLGGNDDYTEYPMTLGSKGVWEKQVSGNLSGKYYTYVVTNFMYTNQELVDPYAKSCGVNGLRGMVVNFAEANPEGWISISTLNINPGDLAVYEAHIADVTSSSTWGGNPLWAKTYLGFCEEGTTYTDGTTTVTTGFDHIKELGVNAVQLLPIFDSANDEINPSFNWGYNPLNYNALDGSYSTNPYDGYARIREFKTLVMKYNQAGITIIMDVVFNHVSDAMTSNFNYLMPGYYYRYYNGHMTDGSGCGNETCSEHYMMRKFMVDSTEFWATEYKLGGFRFDLMGIHDIGTMEALASNLQTKINPNIVVYGEPWAAAGIDYAGAELCSLYNYGSWNNFGCFNSTIRDAVLGSVGNANTWGWVNGSGDNGDNIYAIQNGVMGFIGDDRSNNVQYTVSYVSCHDNYNIADHLATNKITGQNAATMSTLANALVLTSQGISFIQEGEEFLRDKNGEHNSYNKPYDVNELDYSNKITYNAMYQNYKKLCELKASGNITLPVSSCSTVRNSMIYDQTNMSYFYYDITTPAGTYRIIHHNGYDSTATVNLSGYTLYLDTLGKYSSVSGNTTIYPYQTIIAYKSN